VRRETDRIYRILQQLLQFARPTSTHLSEDGKGSLQEAVADTLPLLSPQAAFRNLNITVNIGAALPQVRLPQEQLQQVLLNLLLNAASACKPGGNIHVSAELCEQLVELVVEDDGAGVAPQLRERIFEPFITTKDVGEGSGLGLSVCRGLIEAAGGSIQLDPTRNVGARFVVRLPLGATQC
jgi:two-component system, NtrC family, sensor kinase